MNYTAQDAEDWSRFWRSEVGGTPPAIPTDERQLNITQKEQLRGWDSGRLHQRLFASRKPEGMPAETFAHHLTGAYVPEDIPVKSVIFVHVDPSFDPNTVISVA